MSFLEVVQLVGYGFGGLMTLWMCSLLVRRSSLRPVERLMIALGVSIGVWHIANLVTAICGILGTGVDRLSIVLRAADTVAVVAVTFAYSFLLHIHLHLWADSKGRELSRQERIRVFLSYAPCVFLILAIPHIWQGGYVPMLERFQSARLPFWPGPTFETAFSLWAVYVLLLISITDLAISREVTGPRERYFLRALAGCFLLIASLLLLQGVIHLWRQPSQAALVSTFINLGSLLPTALIAFYIYRYKYLELVIRDSLVLAVFSVLVLALYLLLVRSVTAWLVARFELRSAGVEALLILAMTVIAVPLKRALDLGFKRLFEKEASLYRGVLARINDHRGQYKRLPELLHFIETSAVVALGLEGLKILTLENGTTDRPADGNGSRSYAGESSVSDVETTRKILETMSGDSNDKVLDRVGNIASGFDRAYALRRHGEDLGVMLVSSPSEGLSDEVESVLMLLAEQVSIAIDDSRLVLENVRLESELAKGERLAALGQMAATIAHEVKNPLSAIKSIAQVMKEEHKLEERYSRDLGLIIGEADRLSRSVGQMLSFARTSLSTGPRGELNEVVRSTVELYRANAHERRISISATLCRPVPLNQLETAALRDALINLVDNAIQAVSDGGHIAVVATTNDFGVMVQVSDSGPGVPDALAQQIWQPFFTTRQRGTGLGLSIVARRMEEVGGTVEVAPWEAGKGASFTLRLPVTPSS